MRTLKHFNETFDRYILNIVEKEIPYQRTHKYDNKHFLKYFKLALKDINSWKVLQNVKDYPEDSPDHYIYVSQVYRLWSSKHIFEKAYIELLHDNYFKLVTIKHSESLNLFIDCTFIINKYGSESVYFNPQYHKKNVTKLSIICDENKTALSIVPMEKQNVTFKQDVTCVQETLDNILIDTSNCHKINLIGDKGYVSQEIFKVNNRKIKLIAPKKKGMETKNTTVEKHLLNKRCKIEHVNALIKNYQRVLIRKDRKLSNYLQWIFFSLGEIYCKLNNIE